MTRNLEPYWKDRGGPMRRVALPSVPQRIGCEHPCRLNITALADLHNEFLCSACGARWSSAERR